MNRLLSALTLAALVGCQDTQRTPGAFDTPSALALLDIEDGPFNQPIGYAANLDGGRIAIMALVSGTFLADDPTSVLARADGLATGEGRRIGEMVAYAPGDGTVTLIAADKAYEQLVRVPHVTGLDAEGRPIENETVIATTAAFIDADESGDSPTLRDLVAYQGAAATEDWVVRFDGEDWWVEGSRSGRLPVPVTPGEAYTWDRPSDLVGARLKPPVSFVLEGTATAGDSFRFSTDSGLTEHSLGGTPLHLALSDDQATLAVMLSRNGQHRLELVDPATMTSTTTVSLPADAVIGRMTWSADGTLYAADNGRAAFWTITAAGEATEHPLPFATLDVAPLESTAGERLAYLVPAQANAVWVYDLDADALRDVNAWTPGVQGLEFPTQVRGIGSIDVPFTWLEEDNGGAPLSGKAVAISLSSGQLSFAEESTGCLLRTLRGPRTVPRSQFGGVDIETNFGGVPGAATLQGNGTNARAVQVNPCGGVAYTESWRARYDQSLQAWLVEGSLSGPQLTPAYEDVRYVSDNGAVSFLIRSGATPSVDGWTIEFNVTDGVLKADGDENLDNRIDVPLDLPGDPIGFTAQLPEELSDGWQNATAIPYVLVAAEAADLVARIDARNGSATPWW